MDIIQSDKSQPELYSALIGSCQQISNLCDQIKSSRDSIFIKRCSNDITTKYDTLIESVSNLTQSKGSGIVKPSNTVIITDCIPKQRCRRYSEGQKSTMWIFNHQFDWN